MYEVLQLKFHTYPALEAELLDTGEADLLLVRGIFLALTLYNYAHLLLSPLFILSYQVSDDTFWGCGPDGRGENQLGSLLMRLRQELVEALSRQFDQSGLSN